MTFSSFPRMIFEISTMIIYKKKQYAHRAVLLFCYRPGHPNNNSVNDEIFKSVLNTTHAMHVDEAKLSTQDHPKFQQKKKNLSEKPSRRSPNVWQSSLSLRYEKMKTKWYGLTIRSRNNNKTYTLTVGPILFSQVRQKKLDIKLNCRINK